jgi:hypothetical protein
VRITGNSRISTVIDSHPLSADRLDRMKKEDQGTRGAPILSPAEWQALRNICIDAGKGGGA